MEVYLLRLTYFMLYLNFNMAKSIVFDTKVVLQVSSINIYGWSCNANAGSNFINI